MAIDESNPSIVTSNVAVETSLVARGLPNSAKTFISLVVAHTMVDCFGGIWPVFKKLAGLDLEWAGLIAFTTGLIAMSTQPLFGLWADHGRRRQLILAGAVMSCAGMLLGSIGRNPSFALQPGGYVLMASILLTVKLGQSMFHPAGASLAGGLRHQRRSTFLSVFIAGGMMGYSASQGLFSLVYSATDGHTELLLLVGALVIGGAAVWCRPIEHRDGKSREILRTIKTLRPFWGRLLALYFLLSLTSGMHHGMAFLLPEFLEARHYPPWMVYGGGIALITCGAVLMMVPTGHLADRFGRRRLLLCTVVMSVVTYYAMVLLPTLPVPAFMAVCLIAGAFLGTTNPLGVAMGQSLSPRHSSFISGVLMGLAWALGSISTWISGYLAKQPAIGPIGALAWLGLAGVSAIVVTIALMGMDRRQIDQSID